MSYYQNELSHNNARKRRKFLKTLKFFNRFFYSEIFILNLFFILSLFIGSLLLSLPYSLKEGENLDFIDAIFISTSAITVTGLMPVSITIFSQFGKLVLLLMIQLGGLGYIIFTTFFFFFSGKLFSISNTKLVRKYFISHVEYKVRNIIRDVFLTTLIIEFIGAIGIYLSFRWAGSEISFHSAFFYAVSSFCNAGISLTTDSLHSWSTAPFGLIIVTILIFLGGIGFVVISDIIKWVTSPKSVRYHLSLHSKIVLQVSLGLIIFGTVFFFLVYLSNFGNDNWLDKLLKAFFQSVASRTCGFTYDPNEDQAVLSQVMTIALMFIGGGPASTAGGIKVTTFFLLLIIIFKDDFRYNSFKVGTHQISMESFRRAMVFALRALVLLVFFVMLIVATESRDESFPQFFHIVFEAVSAFTTTGFSLGITPSLSVSGKIVIMFIMFSGKVGLFSLAFYIPRAKKEQGYQLPEQEVLLG